MSDFYKLDKILSFNATIMMIVGDRGVGKTYAVKRQALRDAVRTQGGDKFIILRRYKTELKRKDTIMADIHHEFPHDEFRIKGSTLEWKGVEGWVVIAYFIALSNAQAVKSASFAQVKTIVFDEFIIAKGAVQYLPEEVKVLLDFYQTVDRWQDRVKLYLLANAISITNPYFLEWDIRPSSEFVVKADGYMVCHFPVAAEFRNRVGQTKFGKFVEGTEYAAYAIASQFSDNNAIMVQPKPKTAHYLLTLETEQGVVAVWYDRGLRHYYLTEKRPKSDELYCTIVADRMTHEKRLLTYGSKTLQALRTAFSQGRMSFATPRTRNAFLEGFKR